MSVTFEPGDPAGGGLTDAELRATPVPVVTQEPISVDDNGGSLTVDGPLTDAQLRAVAVPVSGTVAATLSEPISVDDNGSSLTVDGSVSLAAAIPAGTNNIGDVDVLSLPALPAGTNNIGDVDVLSLPALPAGTNNIGDVDIASALPAGTNNIGDVDVLSLPALPAGTNNIGDVDVLTVPAPLNLVGGGTEAAALRVTLANNSTGIVSLSSGSLAALETISIGTALPAGTNNIGDVDVLTLPNVVESRPATATLANVAGSASSVTLQASNASRRGWCMHNDSTATLYVKFGTTASTTSYTVKLYADAFYELPQPCYTGIITGIWASATGSARVTEMT